MSQLRQILSQQQLKLSSEVISEDTELCLVVFNYGGADYAINIKDVQEVFSEWSIAPYPESHNFHLGVVNIRGRIIPVLNLRLPGMLQSASALGKSTGAGGRLLMLETDEHHSIGLVVTNVTKVTLDEVEPAPLQTINIGGRPVVYLDLGVLTQRIEECA